MPSQGLCFITGSKGSPGCSEIGTRCTRQDQLHNFGLQTLAFFFYHPTLVFVVSKPSQDFGHYSFARHLAIPFSHWLLCCSQHHCFLGRLQLALQLMRGQTYYKQLLLFWVPLLWRDKHASLGYSLFTFKAENMAIWPTTAEKMAKVVSPCNWRERRGKVLAADALISPCWCPDTRSFRKGWFSRGMWLLH